MGSVRRRSRAREDLIEIWNYIAEGSEPAADALLGRIEATLKLLADRPRIGRARTELAAGLRSFPVGNYVLFYRPVRGGIDLVRVRSRYLDIEPDTFRG